MVSDGHDWMFRVQAAWVQSRRSKSSKKPETFHTHLTHTGWVHSHIYFNRPSGAHDNGNAEMGPSH